jgi:hypothetical protein
MAEKGLVEMAKSLVEEVKKINEILRDSKIDELCDEIYVYAGALGDSLEGKISTFAFRIEGGTIYVYDIFRASGPIELWSARIPESTDIIEMLKNLISSEAFRVAVVEKMLKTISVLGKELATKADIVRKVQELEEKLREEDP